MVSNQAGSASNLAVENVAKFLQTVVVIDDKPSFDIGALEPNSQIASTSDLDSPNFEDDVHSNLQMPDEETLSSAADPENLYVNLLTNRFADHGIGCAVLRPNPGDEELVHANNLIEVADIVVLDWIINNDNGEMAKRLIRRMLNAEGNTDRMRLIALYSGQPNLSGLPEFCEQALRERFHDDPQQLGEFTFQSEAVRLVIFGKEHTRARLHRERIVAPAELPQRLIQEFALMVDGLLPSLAIAGLSELRSKIHRLLKQFSRDLDPAYLVHRILLQSPQDAEDHALEMLVAEIQSVLESTEVAKHVGTDAICARIDQISDAGDLCFDHLPIDGADDIPFLIENGVTHKDYSFSGWKWANATHAFANHEVADDLNRRFAHLMNVNTRYGQRDPSLTLGTILYSNADERDTYWICMQPKCDAVRITEPKPFPFIPLNQVADHTQDFTIVVKHENSWVLLNVPQNPFNINMFTFQPTSSNRALVTGEFCDSSWVFKSDEGQVFHWVDELKSEHSQRIANQFATSFARVGLSESEWVRRSGKRGK